MYILDICCSALSAGEGGGGECQCNVSKTYYSKMYGLIMNLK